jgi:4-amino-4-deoxy-L-arabinose transferase-like glycosyltransferase
LNTLNPALVPQRAVQRMPRAVLWLFCAAYILPGVFGRDPWKNADITAFGYMMSLVRGDGSLLAPVIAQVPSDGGVLPYWIGAASIRLLDGWVQPALAARLPFALLLLAALGLLWYATYQLARTEAAQPVSFAFGGEAHPVDYARTIADAAVLALIASLGLLQLGHETTPELVQLSAVTLYLYALAASPFRTWGPRVAVVLALAVLAASGGPSTAMWLAAAGAVVCLRSSYEQARRFAWWIAAGATIAAVLAGLLGAWAWRLQAPVSPRSALQLLVWFTWPAWPLVLWTLWRWRRHLLHRHIAVPLATAMVGVLIWLAMNASDRALLLALPPLAILAAFALPTLRRSVSAAIDWFSVFFFSIAALAIWVIYVAMHTGVPAQPAANVAKLAPGFVPQFQAIPLAVALAATLAWLALVQWRAGRHRHPLWKSLILPAGGVTLCWQLLMTLWLPLLDYARSYRPWVQRVAELVPAGQCIEAPSLSRSQWAALEVSGAWRVVVSQGNAGPPPVSLTPTGDGPGEARPWGRSQTTAGSGSGSSEPTEGPCRWLLVAAPRSTEPPPPLPDWQPVGRANRPTDRDESILVYRRR